MKLFAIPYACSMASHIALREAGLDHEITWVTRKSLQMQGGGNLRAINPKGKVSALLRDDGTLVTENLAVLLSIADMKPEAKLAPRPESPERVRLYEWLSFISTEIHKQVLAPSFDPAAPAPMKEYVLGLLPGLLKHPSDALSERRFLLGEDFSVADAYLFWTLLLIQQLGLDLEGQPPLRTFRDAVKKRPSVGEALQLEKRAYALAISPDQGVSEATPAVPAKQPVGSMRRRDP